LKGTIVGDFNTLFPQFLSQCLQMKGILTPIAFLLITGGWIAATAASHGSPNSIMRIVGRTIILVALLVYLPTWGNQIVSIVDDTVKNVLKVDPAQIHDQYKAALELKKSPDGNQSWWEKVVEWRASMVESLMTVAFALLGWIASAIMWWAYILQSAILFIGYALSPIFIGMIAFPSLQEVGRRYLLNLLGVMIWPLGWGVAGLVTQGMLTFMTDRSFLSTSVVGNDLYSLQNLMGLAFLGIWLIFSTIAAPILIQKSIITGSSIGAELFSGAFAAGRAAVAASASTFAAAGMGTGGAGLVAAGVVAMATAAETVAGSALNSGGSLVGSLVQIRASQEPRGNSRSGKPSGFPQNDPTGDKTVQELLRKTRNPYST
jgi:hypothetical protein